jgi:predicted phosphodiesterase
MRVAALYDIHGNLPALDAVLSDVDRVGVDAIVVGGDLAWGPLPRETIDRLLALGDHARFLMGNADREIVEAYDRGASESDSVSGYCASRISRSQRDFLAGLPPKVVLSIDGLGETLFCHGSPRSDVERLTTATPVARLRVVLEGVDQRVVVCGHTHRQFDRAFDGRRVVNAGSIGMPFEGRAGAYWALLGADAELRRTSYDVDQALAVLRASGMPERLEQRLHPSLVEPADPDEVADFFERGTHG